MAMEVGMDCELSESGNYIVVRVKAPMTVELGRECGAQAVTMGEKLQVNKYLFDLRKSPNIERVHANYEFAREDMSRFGFHKDAYSALLVHPEDHSHDFIATAFETAGYNVRLFTEEELAVRWLEIKGV